MRYALDFNYMTSQIVYQFFLCFNNLQGRFCHRNLQKCENFCLRRSYKSLIISCLSILNLNSFMLRLCTFYSVKVIMTKYHGLRHKDHQDLWWSPFILIFVTNSHWLIQLFNWIAYLYFSLKMHSFLCIQGPHRSRSSQLELIEYLLVY